ncbi:hypothetical protein [Piscinibacter sakaiensis]|uniref:hypothetical protein n=1 Tax=Piscinibacter sakaiensis TaxID=1547922 RepID=UPI003AAB8456
MKLVTTGYRLVHVLMAVLFALAAILLTIIAARVGWNALDGGFNRTAAQELIEAVGLLAAAVVALQISETITEEEVIRDADVSAPTRVRRFLSRFFVVVTVALAIEGLVATFKSMNDQSVELVDAALLIVATGVMLAGWGFFVRMNRYAEELEPEAMAEAKREDGKLRR